MTETIYSRFYQHVTEQPDAPCVIDRGRTYTYAQVAKIAQEIERRFPVHSPKVVGIIMAHNVLMIASILAVLRSGGAYIPIETTLPVSRRRFMLSEAQADFIITEEASKQVAPCPQLVAGHHLRSAYKSPLIPPKPTEASAPAYILYTSGTTGRPKGIVVENRNVCHYANAFRNEFHIGNGDTMLQYSVNTFDIFVEEVFASILNGAAIAIPGRTTRNDILKLLDFVAENHVTIISGFPYLLQQINEHADLLPASVRLLISGGDVLRDTYINRLKGKPVMIYNTYGPSESTVCVTYQRCDNIPPLPDGTYPIGHPVSGVDIILVDHDTLKPVKQGDPGEICILGNGLSRGYLGDRPEQSNFVTLPDGRKAYLSGDMGLQLNDSDTFAFLHRRDSQVMILGKRVEPEEVENVLCECPEVADAVVRPVVDSSGLAHLVAYVVPKNFRAFSLKAMKNRIGKVLTSFMIPEFFVKLKNLPLTPNGKIDTSILSTIPITKKSSSQITLA